MVRISLWGRKKRIDPKDAFRQAENDPTNPITARRLRDAPRGYTTVGNKKFKTDKRGFVRENDVDAYIKARNRQSGLASYLAQNMEKKKKPFLTKKRVGIAAAGGIGTAAAMEGRSIARVAGRIPSAAKRAFSTFRRLRRFSAFELAERKRRVAIGAGIGVAGIGGYKGTEALLRRRKLNRIRGIMSIPGKSNVPSNKMKLKTKGRRVLDSAQKALRIAKRIRR